MTRNQRRVHLVAWLILGPTLLAAVVLLALNERPVHTNARASEGVSP